MSEPFGGALHVSEEQAKRIDALLLPHGYDLLDDDSVKCDRCERSPAAFVLLGEHWDVFLCEECV